ncbi:50S ribosomal protein L25/general stress protein Ctc [Nocardioides jiangxiensis]|uniref:Large ribosomal subunit protein bL25 n=1 Tax=Nocardioides jiangxiensis TaxID=3064524 RepID=A0ABT9B236_9ACTN|nr:50S ribosomal protein L25/general stress protein Ctc [Nocardioides sp. WY-20]MDO7868792.1 50S ribosomal protein L25/general stress protein Ctc [Nocardioides sp. WY-20]
MSEANITAELRNEFGKGASRRIRRDGKIPAVIYGHGEDPVHVTLPGHQTTMALRHLGTNAVLELAIGSKTQLALTKAIQVDPLKRLIEHIDFVAVKKGEKVHVDVPVHTTGDAAKETLVVLENATVQVEAEATHIPEGIEVDIEGAEAGTQIHADALTLPKGVTLLSDPELLVVHVTAAPTAAQVEAELAEAEAEAGIEHDAPQAEATSEEPAAEE